MLTGNYPFHLLNTQAEQNVIDYTIFLLHELI